MDRQLKRILELVRKTGDRMVVTDPNGDDCYVVMSLDQYEELIDFSEMFIEDDQFETEIEGNSFVGHKEEIVEPPKDVITKGVEKPNDIWSAMVSAEDEESETWDLSNLSEADRHVVEEMLGNSAQEIRPEPFVDIKVAENVEELAKKDDLDDDVDEEQFYLEPVE